MSSNFRILYAIQNVGGIDFSNDVGDTVPVKQTLRGLHNQGHMVNCIRLHGNAVNLYQDVNNFQNPIEQSEGITNSTPFVGIESGIRRLQREIGFPYFAFFDSLRFYETCLKLVESYDICHEHNGLFCLGASLASARRGVPYILTFSADPIMELELVGKPLRGFHAWAAKKEAEYSFKIAHKIICVSKPAMIHLVDVWNVDPQKIVILPNGVDVAKFSVKSSPTAVRSEFGLEDHLVVSFVGTFQHWHGIDLLVESFAKVLVRFPECKLLLVGDGPARENIERKVANLGIESSVHITGLVPQNRVPEILSAVDVAVVPYPELPNELWFSPLKLYEYMAAGKAVVASNAGQIADVIQDGENGILVKPGRIDELSEAIIQLLVNPERREWIGRNAHQQASECHSWDRYIQQLEEIYQNVLAEPYSIDLRNGAIA